jgi:hypothetical protein
MAMALIWSRSNAGSWRLAAVRRRGESYSDVILRLAKV